jgi:hypothetical protein
MQGYLYCLGRQKTEDSLSEKIMYIKYDYRRAIH